MKTCHEHVNSIRGKFKKKSFEIGRGQQSDKTEVTNAYKLQRLMFHREF